MRYAIIVAAGGSVRYGGTTNKLDEQLLGKSVLQHSVDVLSSVVDVTVVVGRHAEGALYAEGGATRFLSVYNGLKALPENALGTVAIHDGARPFITRAFAERLFAEAERYGSAVPRLFVTDTVYRRDGDKDVPVDRDSIFTVQTPQAFDIQKLRAAFDGAFVRGFEGNGYTDESTLFSEGGNKPHFTDGLRSNVKLTYLGDLPDFRVGNGFDVHPFAEGDGVVLGGVKIPFDKKLQGHSDADALCHAVCDAILSASGNKDIGHRFPDDDPAYEGADSALLLADCVSVAESCGYEVVNVSATVICQAPKIAPHIDAMKARLARICKVAPSCIAISATTTERLGALGNGDGIAVEACALLRSRV